jgi:hypothetical protein
VDNEKNTIGRECWWRFYLSRRLPVAHPQLAATKRQATHHKQHRVQYHLLLQGPHQQCRHLLLLLWFWVNKVAQPVTESELSMTSTMTAANFGIIFFVFTIKHVKLNCDSLYLRFFFEIKWLLKR